MKRAAEDAYGGPAKRAPGPAGQNAIAPDGLPNFCLKVLVSEFQASTMIGRGGGFIGEMRAATGARIHLSGKGEFYPNSTLQEVNLQSGSDEMMQATMQHMLSKILEMDSTQSSSMKVSLVVPKLAASAVIGRGGAMISQIRTSTRAKVHVEEMAFGAGEAAEQVVTLTGEPDCAFAASIAVSCITQGYRGEPWFGEWARQSLCTQMGSMPTGKGYASKGGKSAGKVSSFAKGGQDYGNSGSKGAVRPVICAVGVTGNRTKVEPDADWPGAAELEQAQLMGVDPLGAASPEETAWAGELAGQVADMAAAIPSFVAAGAGPSVSFAVPASRVSGIIGKGGSITREIAAQTGSKVQIRDAAHPDENTVIITGPTLGIVSAYLMVVNRLAELELGVA